MMSSPNEEKQKVGVFMLTPDSRLVVKRVTCFFENRSH